jgi:hypothetical protein
MLTICAQLLARVKEKVRRMKHNKRWIAAATLMILAVLANFSCAANEEPSHSAREEPARAVPEEPDPAFDPLLSTLREMTTAPIMLPANLPSELKNVAIGSTTHGDEYTILFQFDPPDPDQIVQDYVHANVPGTLVAEPASAPMLDPSAGGADVKDLGNVTLPNGTVADLKRVEPPEGTNSVPFTYCTFEEGGHRYTLRLEIDSPTGRLARQTLSTMIHA